MAWQKGVPCYFFVFSFVLFACLDSMIPKGAASPIFSRQTVGGHGAEGCSLNWRPSWKPLIRRTTIHLCTRKAPTTKMPVAFILLQDRKGYLGYTDFVAACLFQIHQIFDVPWQKPWLSFRGPINPSSIHQAALVDDTFNVLDHDRNGLLKAPFTTPVSWPFLLGSGRRREACLPSISTWTGISQKSKKLGSSTGLPTGLPKYCSFNRDEWQQCVLREAGKSSKSGESGTI